MGASNVGNFNPLTLEVGEAEFTQPSYDRREQMMHYNYGQEPTVQIRSNNEFTPEVSRPRTVKIEEDAVRCTGCGSLGRENQV